MLIVVRASPGRAESICLKAGILRDMREAVSGARDPWCDQYKVLLIYEVDRVGVSLLKGRKEASQTGRPRF
jgi:hypothetical protein